MHIYIRLMSDNTPGLRRRYVLQEVWRSPELPICVTVDGQCNHADADYEEDDNYRCVKCGDTFINITRYEDDYYEL